MATNKTKNFSAKHDFTEDMLPHNRTAQFWMILQSRVGLLIKASLMTFVFFIPLLIALSFKTVCVYHFYQQYQTEAITYETLQQYLSYTNLLAAIVYVPCFVIAAVGVSGLNRLTHQLVFGEGILFKEDFFLGVKNNWKQYCVYTFVISMAYALGRLAMFYFGESVACVVVFFVVSVVAVPYFLVLLLYSNVYSSRGGELVKNVFYAFTQGKWRTVVFALVVAVPVVIIFLFASGYLFMLLFALYLLLLPVISLWGNALFATVFDDAFNYLNHVEIVKKGLYVSPKEREIIEQTHQRLLQRLEEKEN